MFNITLGPTFSDSSRNVRVVIEQGHHHCIKKHGIYIYHVSINTEKVQLLIH